MAETSVDYRESYREMDDDDLLALAAEGCSAFTPEAWQAIEVELGARRLNGASRLSPPVVANAPSVEADSPPRIPGWLWVFAAWASLYVLGCVGALVVESGSTDKSLFVVVYGATVVTVLPRGLVLLWRRDTRTRAYWLRVLGGLTLLHGAAFVLAAFDDALTGGIAAMFVQAAVWWAYWTQSRRVNETFSAAPALAEMPADESAPIGTGAA